MKWLILYCLIFLFSQASGQQIRFRNYSVADGLPSSTVRTIAQDDQGYLWFGTKNRISRFDGYQFRNFQFGNNFLHCITRVDSTHLWIGTENGIYILDLETEQFSHFGPPNEKTVYDIMRDKEGIIWVASRMNGLYRYDPVKKMLQNFKAGNSGLSSDYTTRLAQDNDGNIWIGTFGKGLNIYNPATGKFSYQHAGNDFINTIYSGHDGVMWVGTMNGGLCKWQPAQRSFHVYRADGGPYSINDNIVRAICQVSPDKIYIGTEKGLNVLDIATNRFTAYTNKGNDPFSISDNAVYSLFPDRAGSMWIGTFFGGASYFNEKGPAFELYYPTGEEHALSGRAVSSFLEDGPGKLWVATEDRGLQYFNTVTRTFQQYPFLPDQQKLSYHNVHTLLRDNTGNIWIGLFASGINILDPRTGKVTYYKHEPGNLHSLNGDDVFCIYQDRDGQMWIGTDVGLDKFNSDTHDFTRVLQEGLSSTIIYDIYEDDNKTLWFATYNNGLRFYNKKTNEWGKIEAEGMIKLTCLFDDHKGTLWVGSDGGGLYRYNFATKKAEACNDKAHINANIIFGIKEDDAGLIWLTTNNGIYSIDPATNKSRHFTPQDNLQSRQFNYTAFYKMSDGKMFAGGIKGFNAFYPERVFTITDKVHVSFTNFQLFNKNVPVGGDGPLSKQLNYTTKLVLQHDQSVMSFEFAALNFSAPEKLSYAYKMEGFDSDWNYVGDQRKATYTNLSPGTYTFKVKATAQKSNWNVPASSIKVIIKPPFYRTTVAYIIYALLIVLMIYCIYLYIARQNLVKIERLKNKEEQAFYARKIEFFTVMAHEIRTPLSLIMAPLEKLLSLNKWQQEEKQQLILMDENAERLMDLVNQLLDFRRIESDAYEIRKEEVEVVSLVQSIYSRFSSMPYQKNVEFTLSIRVSSLTLSADPEVLNKILSNLLINAFKYANKKVNITIYEQAETVCISVEDDGIGIPAADLKNIFDRFFTTGGTGIGLALARSLADKHGGNLQVESQEGVNTVFTLELPVTATVKKKPVQENNIIENDKLTILVVEDDASIQQFLADSFHDAGYNVLRAANGKAAMPLIEAHAIDLVISDIMMDEMDGFELCQKVKTNVDYSHIPFVLLSARGNSESELKGIESGADAYIMKPFKWKHIIAVTKNLIASRESLRTKFSEQPNSEVSVLTTNSRDKEFMEKVVSIIEERIIDPQLSVEELSRNMAMSRSNLHKKLKSLSGYVPNELIKLVRLKHAARLLLEGEDTVAEVAYKTGFGSPSYFTKCFSQQFNVTPKEYQCAKKQHPFP